VRLTLAYSTDLDDAFMFWALASGRLDARDWGFHALSHERADTATLNAWAREGARDVVAVSIATVPAIAAQYLLLPHGGSVGRNYGPVIVATQQNSPLDGKRVGVPGEGTTCAVLVALAQPGARRVVVPSAPMERAFAALAAGDVDACALIHEGRLTYGARGLHLALDLGRWWQERRGLPLPLGGNVIRRGLGSDAIARAVGDAARVDPLRARAP
jgi:1,4-dihydroxy-6-naphthoate synthase